MAVKNFSLTVTAMVINCAPLLTVVMAGVILKEQFSAYQCVYLLIAFSAVVLMIMAAPNAEATVQTAGIAAYIALALNPFSVAVGNIAMRSMRKLHENVVSTWMSLSMICLFVPIVYIQGDGLSICASFSWTDWLAIIGASISSTLS
jgi:drug/metabolite transporter (DMT)-like permease